MILGERNVAAWEAICARLGDRQWHSRSVLVSIGMKAAEPLGGLVSKSVYEITRRAIANGDVQSRRVRGASGRVYEQLALPGVPNDRAGEVVAKRSPRRGRPAHYRPRGGNRGRDQG